MNKILGTGMCASGVANALRDKDQDFLVFGSKAKQKHTRISSKFRCPPVIGNEGFGGLSSFYHGVSPGWLLDDPAFRKLTGFQLQSGQLDDTNSGFYFVQKKIIRPRFSKNDVLPMSDYTTSGLGKTYLCTSVLGNLSYVSDIIDVDGVTVSDDIIMRVGTITDQDFKNRFRFASRRFDKFSVFPSVYENNIMYSFRPVFDKSIDINFIDIFENFRDLNLDSLFEKFRSSMFLRFGVSLGKPKAWEIFAQINVKDCYVYRNKSFTEVSGLESILNGRVNSGLRYLGGVFSSFTESLGKPISGIHLGYDRAILKGLPDHYLALDTSLNTSLGLHPTMSSYLEAYRLVTETID
jgi:hypothetical protein